MKLLLACVVVSLVASAHAADLVVTPGQSIQAAIVAAAPGDRVLIQPGTYYEAIDFLGKGIEVIGVGGADVTEIDAGGLNTCVVRMMSNEPATARLAGLRIKRGTSVPNAYPPALASGGAGISAYGAAATIEDCKIEVNDATGGYGGGGVFTGCTLRRCIIRNNTADVGGGTVDGLLIECIVEWNTGIFTAGAHFSRLDRCIVRANKASASPGGAWTDLATDTWFDGNQALANNGGGLRLTSVAGSTPRAERCVFRNNYSANWAGGLHVSVASNLVTAEIKRCTFITNHASSMGGAIGGEPAFVDSCSFDGNRSDYDGFQVAFTNLLAPQPQATLVNCTFRNGKFMNNAVKPFGTAAIRHVAPTGAPNPLRLLHCVLDGDDVHAAPNQVFEVAGCVVTGLAFPFLLSPPTAMHDNLSNSVSGPAWITADPQFVTPAFGDYHLVATSPCIAAVAQSIGVADDFEGDPRGGTADVGADEFATHLYLFGLPTAKAHIALRVVGQPNAPVFLLLATDLLPTPVPTPYGPFALGPTLLGGAISLGFVPATGILSVPGDIPANTPSFARIYAQAVVLGTSNTLTNVETIDVR